MVLIGSLAISACGGGESNSPTKYSATGKVIDGYVVGATVFLDINGNGKLDASNEPSTVTTEGGNYELDLNEKQSKCLGYAPTVVDVPVGAFDEDLGKVTEAYQMILPPVYKDQIDFTNRFVTPLTTSLWERVNTKKAEVHSCEDLMADMYKKDKLAQALENAVIEVVRRYNISEAQIYADFVASGDTDIYLKAQSIVKGLQKSYQETIDLQNAHPNGHVQVQYYFKEVNGNKNWYKYFFVTEPTNDNNSIAIQKNSRVSEDLSTETETIYEITAFHKGTPWGSYSQSFRFVNVGFPDYDEVGCTFDESLTIKDDMFDYKLTNRAYDKNINDLINCKTVDLTSKIVSRSTTTSQYNKSKSDPVMRFYINWNIHTFDKAYDFGLPTVINVKDRLNSLDIESIRSNIQGRYKPYTSDEMDNASKVIRSKTIKSGNNEVIYWKTLSNIRRTTYSRRTTYPDHTVLDEKSTDGKIWLPEN